MNKMSVTKCRKCLFFSKAIFTSAKFQQHLKQCHSSLNYTLSCFILYFCHSFMCIKLGSQSRDCRRVNGRCLKFLKLIYCWLSISSIGYIYIHAAGVIYNYILHIIFFIFKYFNFRNRENLSRVFKWY